MRSRDDIGAIVLECHNMAPYARIVQNTFGVPVYDVYTLISWFHAGLSPREFGYPGSSIPAHGWRERVWIEHERVHPAGGMAWRARRERCPVAMTKVSVIGAGMVGVCSALWLQRCGLSRHAHRSKSAGQRHILR